MSVRRRRLVAVTAGIAVVGAVGVLVAARRRLAERRRVRFARQQHGTAVSDQALDRCADIEPFPEPTVVVVMAAYNEAEVIGSVLSELPSRVAAMPVVPVVVVDGGDDDTQDIVERSGTIAVVHRTNVGQGAALRTGYEYAIRSAASVVVTMDADGQHDPDEMEELVAPVVAGQADYVQGTRFAGRYDDAGGARHLGIVIITRVVNMVSGAGITDCANGYRAIRVSSLGDLQLVEPQFSAAELIVEAAQQGLRMVEVPVHIRSRVAGESKKPRRLAYPIGYLGVVWRTARR